MKCPPIDNRRMPYVFSNNIRQNRRETVSSIVDVHVAMPTLNAGRRPSVRVSPSATPAAPLAHTNYYGNVSVQCCQSERN